MYVRHVQVYTRKYVDMYRMYIRIVYMRKYAYMCKCIDVYMYKCIYVNMQICLHVYIHMYICKNAFM